MGVSKTGKSLGIFWYVVTAEGGVRILIWVEDEWAEIRRGLGWGLKIRRGNKNCAMKLVGAMSGVREAPSPYAT